MNAADFVSQIQFRLGSNGKIIFKFICSCAPRLWALTMKNRRESREREKGRIWKEKRRDEGAAYRGEGVRCEWLMRQGFWVHLPSNKNGLIHPFLSRRPAEPHSSVRAGFWNFLFNGRFWRRKSSYGISAKLASFHLQPLWCRLFWSLLSYLCRVPVSLMLGLFTYLQMHTLYCVISPGDHPLSPVSFSLQTLPHSCRILITLFSPFLHSAVFCLFFLYLNTEWPLLVVNVLTGCNFTSFSWLGDIRREISLALARL